MHPDQCPNCGAEVPSGARTCPECGSDEQTGWSEAAASDGLDLPDEPFNYNEFTRREFGGNRPLPIGARWFWWVIAVLLLVAFGVFWLRR